MLVNTMNFTEIRNEIIKDLPKVQVKLSYVLDDFIKKCRKTNKPDGFHHYVPYNSLRGNNYTFQLIYYKSEKLITFSYWVNYRNSKSELTITIPSESYQSELATSNSQLTIYTQHFFDRYNERMNLNLNNLFDIKIAFFESTLMKSVTDITKAEYVDDEETVLEVKTVFNDGIGLGFLNEKDKFLLNNTFISEDEFKGSNLKVSEIAKEQLTKYIDLIDEIYS